MNESIFSTYNTGENRVTASILAVLRCLALPRIERILGALIEDDAFELVRFENQAKGKEDGIPDVEISSRFRLLLETKLHRNQLLQGNEKHRCQLERHLKRLKSTSGNEFVLALTPDDAQPDLIKEMSDSRLLWSSFAALNQAIDELLVDEQNEKEVISERERFLLRELQKMLFAEELVGSSKEILVVTARYAWPLYYENKVYAYIYKDGSEFQPVSHIAFYAANQIHPLVPLILETHDHVVFERGHNTDKPKLEALVNKVLEIDTSQTNWPYKMTVHKVFILSAPDAPETVKLKQPIVNDTKSSSGQRTAFTQKYRYVSLEAIGKAKTTSDLEEK